MAKAHWPTSIHIKQLSKQCGSRWPSDGSAPIGVQCESHNPKLTCLQVEWIYAMMTNIMCLHRASDGSYNIPKQLAWWKDGDVCELLMIRGEEGVQSAPRIRGRCCPGDIINVFPAWWHHQTRCGGGGDPVPDQRRVRQCQMMIRRMFFVNGEWAKWRLFRAFIHVNPAIPVGKWLYL